MAITPLGNQIFINQNMSIASQTQAQHQQKVDFQTVLNIQEFQDREKKVEEVRPIEEDEKIDPDREHEKQKEDMENQEHEEKEGEKKEDEKEHKPPSDHLLDITA